MRTRHLLVLNSKAGSDSNKKELSRRSLETKIHREHMDSRVLASHSSNPSRHQLLERLVLSLSSRLECSDNKHSLLWALSHNNKPDFLASHKVRVFLAQLLPQPGLVGKALDYLAVEQLSSPSNHRQPKLLDYLGLSRLSQLQEDFSEEHSHNNLLRRVSLVRRRKFSLRKLQLDYLARPNQRKLVCSPQSRVAL